ncbi:methylmalonyl-CoA/ethylmalonyl-CoA epimerase [Nocardioides cavernae]|uniref:Methylmalonyl-CoA/ethylmalonyl-CoA epimerase n=1 Tax=Nocardioides cavernae TaxID=1921566 RepID=A0A7Y9H104_9ACTN|nr:VOC family protein [Nocardioides cavernae]NYE35820.1 methylmalonyl-CoA/ethylmalonyl-CoA epimerase [Nocardioides cavernae]
MTAERPEAPADGLVRRFDHVAVAVRDLGAASRLYLDLLGGELVAGGDEPDVGIRTMQVRFPPGVKIELLTPLDEQSYLHAYLDKHGEGLHHVTCFVDDVEDAARCLEAAGIGTTGTRTDRETWSETYVRPSSGFGALVQLAASTLDWTRPMLPDGATADDVVAGRLVWVGNRPQWKETT